MSAPKTFGKHWRIDMANRASLLNERRKNEKARRTIDDLRKRLAIEKRVLNFFIKRLKFPHVRDDKKFNTDFQKAVKARDEYYAARRMK